MCNKNFKIVQRQYLLIGMAIYVLAFSKYFFMPVHLPIGFFIVELLALSTILFLLFFIDKTIENKNITIQNNHNEIEALKAENSKLKGEINLQRQKDEAEKKERDVLSKKSQNIISKIKKLKHQKTKASGLMHLVTDNFEIMAAVGYHYHEPSGQFVVEGTYGIDDGFNIAPFEAGEGLHGHVVSNGQPIILTDIPKDYFKVNSGLGEALPNTIYILPVTGKNGTIVVIELATFKPINIDQIWPEISESFMALKNN
ncbi:hypothetical protein DMA11_02475 [Marinilabiliaceae bacterium JC017]|nr:hypothetical protein DMA11_02475 [Marinilabiliaceae bacterium JC017]